MRILVTGATGCVGRAVVRRCLGAGYAVRGITRRGERSMEQVEWVSGDLLTANLGELMVDCDGLVHLAALVHHAENQNPEDYERINVGLTAALVRAALQSGVDPKRCVFASSTAVFGAGSSQVVSEETPCTPVTLYGKSKLAAEQLVLEHGGVVLRLPLVYGPGDRGNFARMAQAIARGRFVIPMPDAPRSMISADNAAEAIYCCLQGSGGESVFLASDQRDVTLSEIVSWVGAGLSNPRYAPRVPAGLLKFAAQLGTTLKRFGISVPLTRERYDALTRGLCVDTARITRRLGYRPVQSPELAIQETVRSMFSSEQR